MKPQVENMNAIVNSITKAEKKSFALVNVTTFAGDNETLIIGKAIALQYVSCVGKACSISYEQCIAGVTTYVDEDDATASEQYHTTDHKVVKNIVIHNALSLMLACRKEAISDLYADMLALQTNE